MGKSLPPSYGFSDFCLDKAICGHCFVKPAIWTFETYGRVFAPLAKDSNPVVEVIIRVISFVIASIALIFALPLGAFGLLIKASSFCCCVPEEGVPLTQPGKATATDDLYHFEELEPTTESTVVPEPNSPMESVSSEGLTSLMPPSEGDEKLINLATPILDEAQKMLAAIRWHEIDLQKVKAVKNFFQKNHYILGQVLASLPKTKQTELSKIEELAERYQDLKCWAESLGRAHLFQVSRPDHKEGTTKNNGDCLFETFIQLMGLCLKLQFDNFTNWSEETLKKWSDQEKCQIETYQPPSAKPVFKYNEDKQPIVYFKKDDKENFHSYPAHHLRLEAAQWLEENYKKHEQVLIRLIDSVENQLFANLEKLEVEKKGLEGILPGLDNVQSINETQTRLKELAQEIEKITGEQIPAIYKARGEGNQKVSHEPIDAQIKEYLVEIKKPGVFGGTAELFALGLVYKVPIFIHQPDVKDPIKFNELSEKPPFHFLLKESHYRAYVPEENSNPKDGKKEVLK